MNMHLARRKLSAESHHNVCQIEIVIMSPTVSINTYLGSLVSRSIEDVAQDQEDDCDNNHHHEESFFLFLLSAGLPSFAS